MQDNIKEYKKEIIFIALGLSAAVILGLFKIEDGAIKWLSLAVVGVAIYTFYTFYNKPIPLKRESHPTTTTTKVSSDIYNRYKDIPEQIVEKKIEEK